MAVQSSENYTLGMAQLTFYDKVANTTWLIGNIVATSVAPEITFLDHFTVNQGVRKKDRSLITQKAVAINFTFDEITATSLRHFLLGTSTGTNVSADNYRILPMEAGEIKGSASLLFESAYGRDWTWSIPSASFKPDGTFDFNAEDWMTAKGILEVLQAEDTNSGTPYGWITMNESWSHGTM